MERKPHVVAGEAPESDSEDEVQGTRINACSPQGIVVAGEAPESDEENDDGGSVSSCASVTSVSSTASLTSRQTSSWRNKGNDRPKYNTLLHKKLRERNVSLHRNIAEVTSQTIHNSTRDLNAVNQGLLRSQVTLQEAATSIHLLLAVTVKVLESLKMATTSADPSLPGIPLSPT